jgi:AmiR/NasT family two-component response regulator
VNEYQPADGELAALVKALTERNLQLQQALDSRIVIEQAKGVLVERLALVPNDAFEILRRAARSQRRRIHDLAAEVVVSRTTPAVIQAAAAALDNAAAARDEPAA